MNVNTLCSMKSASIALALACLFAQPVVAADLPENETGALYQRAKSQPQDKAERIKLNESILGDSRKCLADHPDVAADAPGRDILVRRVMLPAAQRIFFDEASPEHRKQLIELATEVANSPLWEGHRIVLEKVAAAELLARLEIWPDKDSAPQNAAARIRAFVDRFPADGTHKGAAEFHGQAIVGATRLACAANEQSLADEFCKEIASSWLATAGALDVLAQAGHPVMFEGELTALDGKTLRFPDDAKGKVVVLDFWATWCGPCEASLPHIREVHEQYKDREVLVLGVSCDTPMAKETPEQNRQKVADFIKAKDLPWPQAYSGEWPKVAVKYGVSSIPTVWVIGKDGRILSATARGRESELIERALANP